MAIPALALFAVGAGSSILGTAFEVQGQLMAGQAAKRRADYQAAVLRNNAKLFMEAAEDALVRGRIAVQRQQTATAQLVGRQRVALAASGILVDEGSAADLVADTAFVGEQQVVDLRINAEREALLNEINALNFEADARLAQFTGEQQLKAAQQAVPGTILSGVSKIGFAGAQFAR